MIFKKTGVNGTNVNSQLSTVPSLTNAPKWLQRNCGASFAVRNIILTIYFGLFFMYLCIVWWSTGVI